MKRIITITLLFWVAANVYAQKQPAIIPTSDHRTIEYDASYALVIGNGNYEHFNRLKGVHADVIAVKQALEKYHGFTVILKENLTKANMDNAIREFIRKYGNSTENRLLFYFAGHGKTLTNKTTNDVRGYIVPVDAKMPKSHNDFKFIDKAVSMGQIKEEIRNITSKHVLFIFDACFSGSIFADIRGDIDIPDGILYSFNNTARQIITSGTGDETVPDDGKFRRHFVDAITTHVADGYEDGYLTASELGIYLKNEAVTQYQHPQYKEDDKADQGDFIFVLPNRLRRERGTLKLISHMSGKLYIDNVDFEYLNNGITTYTLTTGNYTAQIFDNGQSLWQQNFTIEAGDTTTITAKPQKEPFEPEMVSIKGGTFQMGSNNYDDEKPIHSVTVKDFYMSKYEVTNEEFIYFLNDINCSGSGSYNGKELIDMDDSDCAIGYKDGRFYFKGSSCAGNKRCPVIEVTWYGANEYCKWLSNKTGKNYVLPTEAEWEYAAGGGSTHQKWAGTNSENSLGNYAWYWKNSGKKTHPVGSKRPNSLGLYDMSGNVYEWCSDWYKSDYYQNSPSDNPKGASNGSIRVVRGGSWLNFATNCRVAIRGDDFPAYSNYFIGLRAALR